MAYLTQDEISHNGSMLARVAQAAASEAINDPDEWTWKWRRTWAAAPGWDAAWESYEASHPDDGDPETPAPDPGADPGVITDGMILSQVQIMVVPSGPPPQVQAALTPPSEE